MFCSVAGCIVWPLLPAVLCHGGNTCEHGVAGPVAVVSASSSQDQRCEGEGDLDEDLEVHFEAGYF